MASLSQGIAMHNAEQCLAKAAEMDTLARTSSPEAAVSYRKLATHWRFLAHDAVHRDSGGPTLSEL
jgi:hypothetical protein